MAATKRALEKRRQAARVVLEKREAELADANQKRLKREFLERQARKEAA